MPGHYVYVLFSPSHKRTYVGESEDHRLRLRQHNAGKVRSTKAYRPWVSIHVESHATRPEALKRERWYKTPVGRGKIASLLKQGGVAP
ncbi:MAG: GIY-YIG nuclease family protein [Bacteroidota bacterium]